MATLTPIKEKSFANGMVHLLHTIEGYPIEVTDTFLPYYTKNAIGNHQNKLTSTHLGSRNERWMVGVSTMSGCPVGCKFCATGQLKQCRNLTWHEIVSQVLFVIKNQSVYNPKDAQEFKINYTRMGEPFLNIKNVRKAIEWLDENLEGVKIHHYLSTIGIQNADYSWIKNNISLQFSVHSFEEDYRDWLIPYKNKISLRSMGAVRTDSELKTTLNLTLARPEDFNIDKLKQYFDPKYFFIKLSPINKNEISDMNNMGDGVITANNLV
jgi:23S rRNA (adenine2503-C2)-methyltransferase